MDPILQIFLSWQFLIFCVAIIAVVFIIRKIAEYGLANWAPIMKETKLWNDLILPILPVVVGFLGGLAIKSYPYPYGLTNTVSRCIFGLGAGLLSTLLYKVLALLIQQKIAGLMTPTASNTRPATTTPTAEGKMGAGTVDPQ